MMQYNFWDGAPTQFRKGSSFKNLRINKGFSDLAGGMKESPPFFVAS